MVKRKLEDRKVYWGIINPKGAKDGKNTSFLSEYQLPKIAKTLAGVPIHINHFRFKTDEKDNITGKIAPAGTVLEAKVNEKTGELWASFILEDNKNGNIAHNMLNNLGDKLNAQELSLGYDYAVDPKTKQKLASRITDLSLCWKGARENTVIKGSKPLKEYLGIKEEGDKNKNKNKKTNFEIEWNSLTDQKLNIKEDIEETRKGKTKKELNTILDNMNSNMNEDIKNESGVTDFVNPNEIKVEKYHVHQAKNSMSFSKGRVVTPEYHSAGASGGSLSQNMTDYANSQNVANNLPPPQQKSSLVNEVGKVLQEAASGKRPRETPEMNVSNIVNKLTQENKEETSMDVDTNLVEKNPENLSPDEMKEYLKQVAEQNKKLAQAVQRLNMNKEEREQQDRAELSAIAQNDIAPWVGEILEEEGQDTAENRAAFKGLLNQIIEKPSAAGRGLINVLSAAASRHKKNTAARAQDANKAEEIFQKERRIAQEKEALQKERDELAKQLNNVQASFEKPVVEVTSAAASDEKRTRQDGGFTGQTEARDPLVNMFYQAHLNADREQRLNTSQEVLLNRAKVLAEDWNAFALPEGEELTRQKFGLMPNEDPNYQWPSNDVKRFYEY